MTSLFHFEDKVHRRGLQRAESIPLIFPGLLCQVLEHIRFPAEPRIEHRQIYDVVMTLDRAGSVPRYFHLRPPDVVEDDLAEDLTLDEQPSQAVPARGVLVPDSPPPILVPTAPRPTDPASFEPPVPVASSAPSPADLAGSSSTAPQHIPISPRDFLAIMDAVRTFSATSASVASAQASLAERMARTETALSQTSTLLQQNQAILLQIQGQLCLSPIPTSIHAQTTTPRPSTEPALPTPAASLDLLAVAAATSQPPAPTALSHPARDGDDPPSTTP